MRWKGERGVGKMPASDAPALPPTCRRLLVGEVSHGTAARRQVPPKPHKYFLSTAMAG